MLIKNQFHIIHVLLSLVRGGIHILFVEVEVVAVLSQILSNELHQLHSTMDNHIALWLLSALVVLVLILLSLSSLSVILLAVVAELLQGFVPMIHQPPLKTFMHISGVSPVHDSRHISPVRVVYG